MQEPFILQKAAVTTGPEIEQESLSQVEAGCQDFPRFHTFTNEEKEVVKRLIHTTTCFSQVLEGVYFSPRGIEKIKELLSRSCAIVSDTNMIRAGLSSTLTERHGNRILCHVNRPDVIEEAPRKGVTRSHLAVERALLENRDTPVLLACGNAPTFLYSAIETIVEQKLDPANIGIIAFPVGFVNVIESKAYTKSFMSHFGVEGILMEGRFGSSPMVVSVLHAIYRLL